jgi:hypothetical protein
MVNNSRFINVMDTTGKRLKVTKVNSMVYKIHLFLKNVRKVKLIK